jgi:hypothetical protein
MLFSKRKLKILSVYVIGVTAVFYLLWTLLDLFIPGVNVNMLNALSTAFGVQIPEEALKNPMDATMIFFMFLLAILAVFLVYLHAYFESTITADIINPEVKLITSSRGVLSTTWNIEAPYVLVRLAHFHKTHLLDIQIKAVLTLIEKREKDGVVEDFLCYLPFPLVTPQNILVMKKNMPWSIAIPADTTLSNTLTSGYHFKVGEKFTHSFSLGKKMLACSRHLHIMITGIEPKSYAKFVQHREIAVDEMKDGQYILHLHRGSFKSLPIQIIDAADLEKFA